MTGARRSRGALLCALVLASSGLEAQQKTDAESLRRQALEAMREGRYREAEPKLRSAIGAVLQLGFEDPRVARSFTELAGLYRLLARFDAAVLYLDRARKFYRTMPADKRRSGLSDTLRILALVRRDQGRFADAEALLTEATALWGNDGELAPRARLLEDRSELAWERGEVLQADRLLRQAGRLLTGRPESGTPLRKRARLERRRGRLARADALISEPPQNLGSSARALWAQEFGLLRLAQMKPRSAARKLKAARAALAARGHAHPRLIALDLALSKAEAQQGSPQGALRFAKQALQTAQRSYGSDHPALLAPQLACARAERALDAYTKARLRLKRAGQKAAELPKRQYKSLAIELEREVLSLEIDALRGAKVRRELLALLSRQRALESSKVALALLPTHLLLARLERLSGRLVEARGQLDVTLEIWRSANSKGAPPPLEHLIEAALLWRTAGQPQAAEREARLAFDRATAGEESSPLIAARCSELLGLLALDAGKGRRAAPALDRAYELRSQALGAAHTSVAMSDLSLAKLHAQRGDAVKAKLGYRRAASKLEAVFGADDARLAPCFAGRARLSLQSKAHERSAALAERAIRLIEQHQGPRHPSLIAPLDLQARALKLLGKRALAKSAKARAEALEATRAERRVALTP